jgi:hypothetical protein
VLLVLVALNFCLGTLEPLLGSFFDLLSEAEQPNALIVGVALEGSPAKLGKPIARACFAQPSFAGSIYLSV